MGVGEVFTIPFNAQGTAPQAVRTPREADPAQVAAALGLKSGGRAIAVMGGAALMDDDSTRTIRSGLEDGLAQFAQEHEVTIVDGGTAAGVMELLGVARARRGLTFPLVGVTVASRASWPGHEASDEAARLDAYHSHFVLTGGDDFGDESDLLAGVALTVAADGGKALGLIINGGAIVRREAHARAIGPLKMPLLVLDDSGRFADELAEAARSGTSDPELKDILEQGEVHVLSAHVGAKGLRQWLENYFGVSSVEASS
ncbi:MAG: hypothetical protein U0452_03430 [Anaerolineae bacterium]